MSTDWIPPLPPGFEARWDANQRAYFFIDHKNKATTWIDPRPDYYAKQPKDHPPPNPKPSSHGEPVFGFRGSGTAAKKESTFVGLDDAKFNMLKNMFPTVGDDTLRVTLKIKNNNVQEARTHLTKAGYIPENDVDHSSAGHLKMENIVKKLQKIYPIARYDIIRDIVAGCNSNESNARSQLESMGYKAVGSLEPARPKSGTRSRSRTPSPTPTPTKPKISEAEKRRVITKIKGKHPDLAEDFITMGLDTLDYKEDLFETMLKSLNNSSESHTSGASGSTARSRVFDEDVSFKPSGSLVPETFSGGNEPVVFGHDIDQTPSTSTYTAFNVPFGSENSKQKSTHSPTKNSNQKPISSSSKKTSPQKTSDTVAKMTKTAQKQKGGNETIEQHAARMKAQERQRQQQSRSKTISHVDPSQVVLDQPRSSLAKGPDPTIRRGADKTLLLQDYVSVSGPNPEYYQGPDRSRVQGSQGAVGADSTLSCGPQADHHNPLMANDTSMNLVATPV